MILIIQGILHNFPKIKQNKTKVKIEKLDLTKDISIDFTNISILNRRGK